MELRPLTARSVVLSTLLGSHPPRLPARYLVRVGDRAAFARYAHKLLKDPDLGRRLGAAGQERARREFSVQTMVERHAALYREVLA